MREQELIEDIESLIETTDTECKFAQGRDGRGKIPSSIWETYSAMANTAGGVIYLGVEETAEQRFTVRGIKDVHRIQKDFWNNINNQEIVNRNIISDKGVQTIDCNGLHVLQIRVPRADRKERPIHLGKQPFGNTYVRRHEGDYRADDETVRRMLAEAVEDVRDDKLLEHYGLDALEMTTVNGYRNRYSAVKPDSVWLNLSTEEFLERIGAIGKDRQTGKLWLRKAGLLMFGSYNAIKEVFPYYMVDYQERPPSANGPRWIDRIVPDDGWSGNLYDFYQRTIRKLTAELKVPFQLVQESRIDDTPVHRALREALTNALIHADYTGRGSILVVKRPGLFEFTNPGLMRVSIEQALAGGKSDCRNHRIQDMFRYIGLGDHAGSGIPNILQAWKSQHWRAPSLDEDLDNEQTSLTLGTSSLLPDESIAKLQKRFKDRFNQLSTLQRIALVTAETEGVVSHGRLKTLANEHPKDISVALAQLVKEGFLHKEGATRATKYFVKPSRVYGLFSGLPVDASELEESSPDLEESSPDLEESSPDLEESSPDLEQVLRSQLVQWGYQSMPGKIAKEKMETLILILCQERWLTLKQLSQLLSRDPKTLQDQYLTEMLATRKIKLKYPSTRTHPEQAYGSGND